MLCGEQLTNRDRTIPVLGIEYRVTDDTQTAREGGTANLRSTSASHLRSASRILKPVSGGGDRKLGWLN